MRASETLDDLASELNAMTPRARRQVLARLTPAERDKIERRLDERPATPPSAEVAATEPLSPWLSRAIEAARSGTSATMAPRTQAALVESADAVRRLQNAPLGRDPRETGRSLVEAFGGMLPTRRPR